MSIGESPSEGEKALSLNGEHDISRRGAIRREETSPRLLHTLSSSTLNTLAQKENRTQDSSKGATSACQRRRGAG